MSQPVYSRLKVLSADDSNVIRKILRKALASFDISDVDEARDGREALDKIRENHYDVILLDWTMPRMTGLEVLKEIRKDPEKKNIPVIMITAECMKKNFVEAAQAGVSEYITKPFTAEALGKRLKRALKA